MKITVRCAERESRTLKRSSAQRNPPISTREIAHGYLVQIVRDLIEIAIGARPTTRRRNQRLIVRFFKNQLMSIRRSRLHDDFGNGRFDGFNVGLARRAARCFRSGGDGLVAFTGGRHGGLFAFPLRLCGRWRWSRSRLTPTANFCRLRCHFGHSRRLDDDLRFRRHRYFGREDLVAPGLSSFGERFLV